MMFLPARYRGCLRSLPCWAKGRQATARVQAYKGSNTQLLMLSFCVLFNQLKSSRIHAVALTSWRWTIVKYVT